MVGARQAAAVAAMVIALGGVGAGTGVAAAPVPAVGTESAAQPVTCVNETVAVVVQLSVRKVSGTYCRGADPAPDAVVVTVPGATYNRAYWDFPYEPETYSFSRAMARTGIATFAIDRLGTGASSPMLSVEVTSSIQADAIHQVIQHVRHEGLAGHAFAKVILAGHSLGSMDSSIEAGTYHDVDGLLITGMTHSYNLMSLVTGFTQVLGPAPLAGMPGRDPGYLTTYPGHRDFFYQPGAYDPAVVEADEQTKDVVSVGEVDGIVTSVETPIWSARVTVPVFVVVGQRDIVMCGGPAGVDCGTDASLATAERSDYPNATCFQAASIPGMGHDLNLVGRAVQYQDVVWEWLREVFAGGCPS